MPERSPRRDMSIDRRGFLGLIGATAAVPLVAGPAGQDRATTADLPYKAPTAASFSDHPFALGVASGDPWPDSVVIWTRLAPKPLETDGGMTLDHVPVHWQVATDEEMTSIVREGTMLATRDWAYSIHVEVDGLAPDREYYYRFKAGRELSPVGRTRTPPAADAAVASLAFATVSCQNYAHGLYTAYRYLANEDLAFVVHLGDYIYEGLGRHISGRAHLPAIPKLGTLDEYRVRYGQYKSDPLLQAAHAAFPFVLVMDDHEVDNNWADEYDGQGETGPEFLARRAAAMRAYYENLPLRRSSMPTGIDMRLYRRFRYGDLAEFNVLDTRQYRSRPINGGGISGDCPERSDPGRSILGGKQERWLLNGLSASTAQWNVLAQQILLAQRDRVKGPAQSFLMEQWDGYRADRDRLLNLFGSGRVTNPIVLSGDAHSTYVNDLKENFDDPDSATVGTEFLGTSISSGGNGVDTPDWAALTLAENPHVRFINDHRGYLRFAVDREQWRCDLRVVHSVTEEGAPIHDRASFVVEDGRPGVLLT